MDLFDYTLDTRSKKQEFENEVKRIRSFSEEVAKEYLSEKLNYLENNSEKHYIAAYLNNKVVSEFINSRTEISKHIMAFELVINDMKNVVDMFIKSIKAAPEKGYNDFEKLTFSILFAINNYYGYLSNESENSKYCLDRSTSRYEHMPRIEMSEFKGKGLAVCAERAPLAHNLFMLMGVESHLIAGYLNGGAHIFNVFRYDGELYLYDAQNYTSFKSKDNNLRLRPFVYKISEEEFENFKNDAPIKLKRVLEKCENEEGQYIDGEEFECTYSLRNIKS